MRVEVVLRVDKISVEELVVTVKMSAYVVMDVVTIFVGG